jgi:hypothetical protein
MTVCVPVSARFLRTMRSQADDPQTCFVAERAIRCTRYLRSRRSSEPCHGLLGPTYLTMDLGAAFGKPKALLASTVCRFTTSRQMMRAPSPG